MPTLRQGGTGIAGAGMGRVVRKAAGAAVTGSLTVLLAAAVTVGASEPARAQGTLNDRLAARTAKNQDKPGAGGERLLVEAKELVYDNDKNTVSAVGNAELHYGPRTLLADRVRYDRNTGRVFAEGNVRLTDETGSVVTGDKMELTDDFKSGFIDSLRVQQTIEQRGRPARVRFSAPRAERIAGETTTFEYGTYTACEPCKDHPERPPLWQVKAARIIHNNEERRIYYEDSYLEVAGIPIAYLPYFYSPDPTVRRDTGFLAPHFVSSNVLGYGIGTPFFWNIAPDYDLTIEPTFLSKQGVLGQAEWRQRLANGFYNVRVSGIFQSTPSAFLPGPLGSGDRDFRGSIESAGQFYLAPNWRAGWDVVGVTDKWFLDNYRIRNQTISTDYFREAVSTAFLIGQGDRSWFEARGYYFKGLSTFDWQKQQPIVAPVIDYDKRRDGPDPIGGEVRFQANFTHLSRDATQYTQIPRTGTYLLSPSVNGITFPLYSTCSVFERGQCLVSGLAGDTTRATAQVSWRRTFTDEFGQRWQPFAYLRGDAFFVNPNTTGFQNPEVSNLFSPDSNFSGRVMPAVGLEYRYPFVADFGPLGVHTISPVAQVIARPSETHIGRLPNEDAQSLVFDDTSLFAWDKFSGYDRVEGGVRANLGAEYSITGRNGFYLNAMAGESIAIAGVNSFRRGDIANVGRDSGLEQTRSDFVTRFQVSPNQNISFITRARFDNDTFAMKRLEAGITAKFAPFLPLEGSLIYARYAAQPELGFDRRREGLQASALYNITPNWFVTGSVLFDLSHYLQVREFYATAAQSYFLNPVGTAPIYDKSDKFYVSSSGFGFGYRDECTTISLNYLSSPIETAAGLRERNQTFLLRIELRTLGEANFRQNLSTSTTADGIATAR
ncbi:MULTISPECIES: LPS-assembly protein LptD [Methylobacterium]|jgi:LPS-assembly protein|uniref:LPS-assembly protein LptD n=2 Tax=Methylobacterium TaxID=407 RepID=A0A0C6F541_9HYPH|nr:MULTISPECIES: LPS-assembly protein LptD [Methylobacterium]MBZ6413390.1 LPS-assembly protein LptD [Methylobacterium sp.]BAQ47841.1 organic solvent tolerance protein [Methylobacterium aquaticum]SFE83264.1 LPS-assembly protein [Methylobacterium sp. yr596]